MFADKILEEANNSFTKKPEEKKEKKSNALLNSYNTQNDIAARSQYLQQYFPKTIAKLSEYLFK